MFMRAGCQFQVENDASLLATDAAAKRVLWMNARSPTDMPRSNSRTLACRIDGL